MLSNAGFIQIQFTKIYQSICNLAEKLTFFSQCNQIIRQIMSSLMLYDSLFLLLK